MFDTCIRDSSSSNSYENILLPISQKLIHERENFPMTIIYMKLKYCGIAYALFERVIRDKFVGEDQSPCARLFCQFHAPQTSKTKKEILSEIKRHNSRIHVIFATTALGMGVNAPYVDNVIHITPPASIEAYMQEFGRAGRKGQNAKAVLFYNNSDIAANKENVEDDMKKYCLSTKCLRSSILNYFRYPTVKQEKCCSSCCESYFDTGDVESECTYSRELSDEYRECLMFDLENIFSQWRIEDSVVDLFDLSTSDVNIISNILDNIGRIETAADILNNHVWNE